MSFTLPTLRQLDDQARADMATRLPGADSRLRVGVLATLARVIAATVFHLYGWLDWAKRQFLPDQADAEELDRQARLRGLVRRAATRAEGTATLTGTPDAIVPAGTLLQRVDGVRYATVAEAEIGGGGTVATDVRAVDAGAAGNVDDGVALTFVSPVVSVQTAATLTTAATGGADVESDARLRARVLARWRKPPQGGAAHDYEQWATEVAGVTRAWTRPNWTGLGKVGVAFMMDDREDPIPISGDITTVQAYLDARRPVCATVVVFAPTPLPIDPEIRITPDTADVRAAVEAELLDLLRRSAELGSTILRSHITEAISAAVGETDHELIAPAADVEPDAHEIVTLGDVTWA